MDVTIAFVLWFLLCEGLLTALQFLFRKKKMKPGIRPLLIAGKFLLAILLAFLPMGGPVQLRPVQPFMMAAYAALFADAAADCAYSIVLKLTKKERRFPAAKTLSLVFGVSFFIFGVINMETVTPKRHVYSSPKLTQEYTLVFAADMHVGSAQLRWVTEKTVSAIGEEAPAAVILGGDIVDDYTTKEEMEELFRLFGALDAPVYYVYGNHDRQGHAEYAGGRKFTPEELEAAAQKNGVTVLKDEFVRLAPDLTLLGREDISEGENRRKTADLTVPDKDSYLVVADHQPSAFKEAAALGADLQLSGHTHAGQLFPLGLLYRLIGYCYGDYHEGSAVMNVSSGACGWRVPLRTDAGCHYEVVRLVPEEK